MINMSRNVYTETDTFLKNYLLAGNNIMKM